MGWWAEPRNTVPEVNAAARLLVEMQGRGLFADSTQTAIINSWRSSHSFPLNTFAITLRKRAKLIDPGATPAQRIKRLPSIVAKLTKRPRMKLSQMQDLGGCRAVLRDNSDVYRLLDMYENSRFDHEGPVIDDYLQKPQETGYRSVHLVYRYRSRHKPIYHGLKIELQIRSRDQHAWATAVETVGTFLGQNIKAGEGDLEWLRFFALMANAMAAFEGTAAVPNTPDLGETIAEARELAARLNVQPKLRAYRATVHLTHQVPEARHASFFLMKLDGSTGKLDVITYNIGELERASSEYFETELLSPHSQVALVTADSLASLREAYPNFFLDTSRFMQLIDEVLGTEVAYLDYDPVWRRTDLSP